MMRPISAALLCVCAAVTAPQALAAEAYSSYDNFDAQTSVNPSLWLFGDRQRLLKGAALTMIQRDWGLQTDNTGSLNQTWGHDVASPGAITQMRASVTVNDFSVTGCASNPTPSQFQARIIGAFFNSGATPPSSRIGDVVALVRIIRSTDTTDAAGVLRVQGVIAQCTTTDCNYGTSGLDSVDLGTTTAGETLSLRLEWDKPRKRFNFYRGTDPVKRLTYVLSDSQPAYFTFRQIGTRTQIANCLSGARGTAFVDAKFDNFAVNVSALPARPAESQARMSGSAPTRR